MIPRADGRTQDSPTGVLLVNSYNGLGDAVLHAPFLLTLCRLYPGTVAFPHNPMVELYQELELPFLSTLRSVSTRLRRFMDWEPRKLCRALREAGITRVLNLRRDRLRYPRSYLVACEALRVNGIVVEDIGQHLDITEQSELHVQELTLRFAHRLGIAMEAPSSGWLRNLLKPHLDASPASVSVGLYLGASQSLKRFPVDFWREVVVGIAREWGVVPHLIGGVTPAEIDDAMRLCSAVNACGVQCRVSPSDHLAETLREVATLTHLISADTFMVHLAESLGVSVIGLYNATDGRMYGPRAAHSRVVQSPYYASCELRTTYGNCEGWERGCDTVPCREDIGVEQVLAALRDTLRRGWQDASTRAMEVVS